MITVVYVLAATLIVGAPCPNVYAADYCVFLMPGSDIEMSGSPSWCVETDDNPGVVAVRRDGTHFIVMMGPGVRRCDPSRRAETTP